jgi:hypothetical protein
MNQRAFEAEFCERPHRHAMSYENYRKTSATSCQIERNPVWIAMTRYYRNAVTSFLEDA